MLFFSIDGGLFFGIGLKYIIIKYLVVGDLVNLMLIKLLESYIRWMKGNVRIFNCCFV